MRRVVILALLLVGMRLILPLGSQGQGSETLLSFGFLILAAYTVGEISAAAGLPKIVGYLVAGVLFGPHVLGTVTARGTAQLSPVSDLAIALIAFLAGAELRWSEVKEHGVALAKIMVLELSTAFVAVAALLFVVRDLIPPLRGLPVEEALAFVLLFASVAIVHSPAVTLALLSETGDRGPIARTTLGIVLLADVAVVLLFSSVLAVARSMAPPSGPEAGMSFGAVVWEIAGALLIGAVIGAAIAAYLRFVGRELVLFAVLIAFFGVEIARIAHVELLLTLLMAGFLAENLSEHGEELRQAANRSAAPVFVIFFALSGAKIDLMEVAPLLPLVLPIAVVRAAGIWGGVRMGARWAGVSSLERDHVWMGLVSQAGVAIGLAAILAEAYPTRGSYIAGMLLALIAVNESVGPILFRRALAAEDAGTGSATTAGPPGRTASRAG
jgi:Kef-type K+ transport system membrane component KefB